MTRGFCCFGMPSLSNFMPHCHNNNICNVFHSRFHWKRENIFNQFKLSTEPDPPRRASMKPTHLRAGLLGSIPEFWLDCVLIKSGHPFLWNEYVTIAVESQFKQLRSSPPKKVFRGFNKIRTRGLCVRAAVLYQLSYEDPYTESRPIYWVHQPVKGMKHRWMTNECIGMSVFR